MAKVTPGDFWDQILQCQTPPPCLLETRPVGTQLPHYEKAQIHPQGEAMCVSSSWQLSRGPSQQRAEVSHSGVHKPSLLGSIWIQTHGIQECGKTAVFTTDSWGVLLLTNSDRDAMVLIKIFDLLGKTYEACLFQKFPLFLINHKTNSILVKDSSFKRVA